MLFKQKLINKTERYLRKYKNNSFAIKFRLICWILRSNINDGERIFRGISFGKFNLNLNKNLNIFIKLSGGIGDVCIALYYLQALYKYINTDLSIYLSTDQNSEAIKSLIDGHSYIKGVYNNKELKKIFPYRSFDLRMEIVRFPKIISFNEKRIKIVSSKLLNLIYKYNEFNSKYFNFSGTEIDPLRNIYSLNNGFNRRTQADLYRILNYKDNITPLFKLDEHSLNIITRLNLKIGTYITVQRGVDANFTGPVNIRNWPYEYYQILLKEIKVVFPNLKIVLLGKEDPCDYSSVDVDLRGKTSFEELKVILKYSLLHIDGECGMVHIKTLLHGISAVFFGQTSIDFCGYPKNINLKAPGNICPHWCEWVTPDWMVKCNRGFDNPPCMYELKPEFCFERISKYLESRAEEVYSFTEITDAPELRGSILLIGGKEHNELKNSKDSVVYTLCTGVKCDVPDNSIFGDLYNISCKDDAFDFVVSDIELNEFSLYEIKRILKTGGFLFQKGKMFKKSIIG